MSLVGSASFWGEVNALSESGLAHAEMLTLPLILLVLLALYGGVVAALVSLSVGVTSILASFAVLSVVARQTELSLFVENTATMLGLGVGVDYSLFVIARFKEELAKGRTVDEALAVTMRTSGETVIFSGITIIAAMATLFLVPLGVITSIALGAVVVVAFAILTSVLLLPVLLRILGRRINAGRIPWRQRRRRSRAGRRAGSGGTSSPRESCGTRRLPRRRPRALLAVAVAGRRDLTTFTPDARSCPTSSPIRQGFDRMQSEFGAGSTSPITVLVTSPTPLDLPRASARAWSGWTSGSSRPRRRSTGFDSARPGPEGRLAGRAPRRPAAGTRATSSAGRQGAGRALRLGGRPHRRPRRRAAPAGPPTRAPATCSRATRAASRIAGIPCHRPGRRRDRRGRGEQRRSSPTTCRGSSP